MHVEWWYSYTPSREPAGGGTSAAALCMQQRWPDSWRWHCLKLLCQDLLQDVLRSPDIQDILKDSTTETSNKCENCEGDKWKTVIRDYYSRNFFEWQLYPLRFLWSSIFFLCTGADADFIWYYKSCKFSVQTEYSPFPQNKCGFLLAGYFS